MNLLEPQHEVFHTNVLNQTKKRSCSAKRLWIINTDNFSLTPKSENPLKSSFKTKNSTVFLLITTWESCRLWTVFTILLYSFKDWRDIKYLLTEREVHTVKYLPEVFVRSERQRPQVCTKKQKANTYEYKTKIRTSKGIYYMALGWFSCPF